MNVKASRWRTVAFCSTCWSNKEKETRSVQYKERTLVQCHCIAWCNPLTHCSTAYAYYQHLFNVIFFLKLLLTKIMAKYVRWLQQHSVSVLWILICSVINIAVSNCASAGIETFAWCLMLIVVKHMKLIVWNTSSRIVSLLNEIGEVISIVRAVFWWSRSLQRVQLCHPEELHQTMPSTQHKYCYVILYIAVYVGGLMEDK